MPAMTIKNIPDELYNHLKAAALVHRRSVNSELIYRLEASLLQRKAAPAELLQAARALRQQVGTKRVSTRAIDAAKREGRR